VQALVLEAEEKLEAQSGAERSALAAAATTFYEVTIASIDQPKLLSRLSESLVSGGVACGCRWLAGWPTALPAPQMRPRHGIAVAASGEQLQQKQLQQKQLQRGAA